MTPPCSSLGGHSSFCAVRQRKMTTIATIINGEDEEDVLLPKGSKLLLIVSFVGTLFIPTTND